MQTNQQYNHLPNSMFWVCPCGFTLFWVQLKLAITAKPSLIMSKCSSSLIMSSTTSIPICNNDEGTHHFAIQLQLVWTQAITFIIVRLQAWQYGLTSYEIGWYIPSLQAHLPLPPCCTRAWVRYYFLGGEHLGRL